MSFSNVTNNTDFEDVDQSVIDAIGIVTAILTVVGFFGNSGIILIVLSNRSMRNRPNALVASLAVGDLLVVLVSAPLRIYQMVYYMWPFGLLVCKFSHTFSIISQAVSIFSMVALSHDRYRAIVTPMNYSRFRGSGHTVAIISVVWFLGFIFSIPALIFSEVIRNEHFTYCIVIHDMSTEGKVYTVMRGLVLFIMPLMIINVYYCMISRKLIASTRALPGEVHDKRSQISSRKRLAYLVLAIIVLFIVCWFPFFIFQIIFHVDSSILFTPIMTYLRLLAEALTYANSCINPILITVVSSTYRKYFCSYLRCRCFRKAKFIRPRASTVSSKASSARTRITEFA
ncbi:neuromedin-B receptor-like [Acanthaster planci]|uniref:Neuromedin-B receptor-like n=1 Tax=Acanthaster planci TaxID=133434 RepID=A0A8B7XI99_ACAPL|nr:neuromedin-B receptor-like [Acanthaster planci]XP_022079659.1 neuromedin-B receptor-like [Acanthaster planci]XP_022079660.1 neuromedin-B receptor-like [Acanthaster planci]